MDFLAGSHVKGHGVIRIYSLSGQAKLNVTTEVKRPDPLKTGNFGASSFQDRNLATGDFAGHLAVWDLENLPAGPVFSVKAHDSIINCIDGVAGLGVGRGAPEIVTGSRDGHVKVWDVRIKDKPVACMQPKGEVKGTFFKAGKDSLGLKITKSIGSRIIFLHRMSG